MYLARENLICILTNVFFYILFMQSSVDKLHNWKAELEFNKEHFAKTSLRPLTPLMLAFLTLMEFGSAVLSIAGLIILIGSGRSSISFYANCLCSVTLICLFFGQRMAKDYGGAQALVSYFILSLIGVYFSYPP